LSDWYFVNRQDRYILFKNEFNLSNFYENLIDLLSSASHSTNSLGELQKPKKENVVKEIENLFKIQLHENKSDTLVFPTLELIILN
jgi:GTP1/Obg family GTP-binding protein